MHRKKTTYVSQICKLRWMSGWWLGFGRMNILGVFNMDSRFWHNFEINKSLFELAMSVLQNI